MASTLKIGGQTKNIEDILKPHNNEPAWVGKSTPSTNINPDEADTVPKYDTSSWDDTEKGSEALKGYTNAQNAIDNYGDFVFSEKEWLESIKDSIENYGDFSYDVNSDALYQQYADQYIRNGRLAMQDTMGQAATLTGGYGNSYAQTAGNQAYQSYVQELNNKIPELYQLALDRYLTGKEDLYNQYGMLLNEYEREYGLYSEEYNKLLDALGIASDNYYKGADMFYAEQNNKNDVLGQQFSDSMTVKSLETTEQQNAYDTLASLIATTGYIPTPDEMKAAGMSDAQGNAYLQMYNDSIEASSGTSSSTGDTSGTANIPDNILTKAASFNSNKDLASYLDGLTSSGIITDKEADAIYIQNMTPEQVSLSQRDWTLVDDGGINWFGVGIDANAKYKDQYGNTYTGDKLRSALVDAGMSKDEAESYIKKLEKRLGA